MKEEIKVVVLTESQVRAMIDLAVEHAVAEVLARAPSGDPDEMLDASAVGKILGRSAEAVRAAYQRGTLGIEAIRIGRRSLRWRRGDVLALARKEREP